MRIGMFTRGLRPWLLTAAAPRLILGSPPALTIEDAVVVPAAEIRTGFHRQGRDLGDGSPDGLRGRLRFRRLRRRGRDDDHLDLRPFRQIQWNRRPQPALFDDGGDAVSHDPCPFLALKYAY